MPPKASQPAQVESPSSVNEAEAPTVVRLTPEQKVFLETYFDDYDAANTKITRRAVAVKAATQLLAHFNITDKQKSSLIRNVCCFYKCSIASFIKLSLLQAVQSFLYDRFGREDSILRVERYGFLKTVYGRKLWARSEWGTLLPLIHARMRISNEHFLTAYHAITKPKFNALPEVERKVWDEEAKAMNEGNGTEESKAM